MLLPKPTEQHRKLQALVGNWIGENTFYPSPFFPQGGTATTKYNGRLDLGSFFVIGDEIKESGGQVFYQAHKVFGWDDALKHYTFYLVDSTGANPTAPAVGAWEGDTLTFVQVRLRGQHVRYAYSFSGDHEYTFRLGVLQNGEEWIPWIKGKYRRV